MMKGRPLGGDTVSLLAVVLLDVVTSVSRELASALTNVLDFILLPTARQDEEDLKPLKLHYEEMTPCLKEVTKVWQVILERPEKRCDLIPITRAIKDGM